MGDAHTSDDQALADARALVLFGTLVLFEIWEKRDKIAESLSG
jgi:hypothetical protein